MTDTANVADVVRRAAGGDQAAWNDLVGRFTNLLWSIARAHRLSTETSADVVQTTWLRLLEHLDRLTEPERVGAWLATTARHECLRMIRKGNREQATEDAGADKADVTVTIDEAILLGERDAALWRALTKLGGNCERLLRTLMADPPPSYEDVSSALGMPIGSIGPTRGRCLNKLRGLAADEGITASV